MRRRYNRSARHRVAFAQRDERSRRPEALVEGLRDFQALPLHGLCFGALDAAGRELFARFGGLVRSTAAFGAAKARRGREIDS
ncbi:hypothetical protein QWJ07_27880 [Frankia sp. RB7]|nr:hypothetical protein [Frankia sp. RB7]